MRTFATRSDDSSLSREWPLPGGAHAPGRRGPRRCAARVEARARRRAPRRAPREPRARRAQPCGCRRDPRRAAALGHGHVDDHVRVELEHRSKPSDRPRAAFVHDVRRAGTPQHLVGKALRSSDDDGLEARDEERPRLPRSREGARDRASCASQVGATRCAFCAWPVRSPSATEQRVDAVERLDLAGNHVAMPCAVHRLGERRRPLARRPDDEVRDRTRGSLRRPARCRRPRAASWPRGPVAVARARDDAIARADCEERLGRGGAERHDAMGLPREGLTGASRPRATAPRQARAAPAGVSSPDEPVLVQLLDERRPRHAEPSRGLALVVARRLEGLGDERALEGLDARAQRVAGPGSPAADGAPTTSRAPPRAIARGRA